MESDWSNLVLFAAPAWNSVPDEPGVYCVFEDEHLLYVGMAGHAGRGSLRRRLRDHLRGGLVNMLQQYLWFGVVQHADPKLPTTPQEAARRCRAYMEERLSFRCRPCTDAREARALESVMRRGESPWGAPKLNPSAPATG